MFLKVKFCQFKQFEGKYQMLLNQTISKKNPFDQKKKKGKTSDKKKKWK